jgi:hypothetical protein
MPERAATAMMVAQTIRGDVHKTPPRLHGSETMT